MEHALFAHDLAATELVLELARLGARVVTAVALGNFDLARAKNLVPFGSSALGFNFLATNRKLCCCFSFCFCLCHDSIAPNICQNQSKIIHTAKTKFYT